MEKDEVFMGLLNLLDAQMAILTSNNFKLLLGCSVPNYISTRWLSKINATSWILKHQALIETIIKNQIDQFNKESIEQLNICFAPESFIKIKIFSSLIYPFHRLTQVLESNAATVGDIFPLFQMLDKFLENLESNQVFSELKGAIALARKNLSIRIKKNYDENMLIFTYLSSFYGRLKIRKMINLQNKSPNGEIYEYHDLFDDINFVFSEEVIDLFDENNNRSMKCYSENDSASVDIFDDTIRESGPESIEIDDEEYQEEEEEEEEEEEDILEIESIFLNNDAGQLVEKAEIFITNLCNDLGIDSIQCCHQFRIFLTKNTLPAIIHQHYCEDKKELVESMNHFFESLLIGDLNLFAQIALRFNAAPASEAACERGFSFQKLDLVPCRNRLHNDFIQCLNQCRFASVFYAELVFEQFRKARIQKQQS